MRTGILLVVGPPFSYDIRLRSVNVAGHFFIVGSPFWQL